MLILNNVKFAKNEDEFVNSLFERGGTCSGYYKVYKNSVSLFDHNKKKIGVIVNNVLGKATKQDNGKYWYSYGDIDLIGKYDSYTRQCEEIQAITNKYNLRVKH